MKKRSMKKWIPRDTDYCYKILKVNKDLSIKIKKCRNLIYSSTIDDIITTPKEPNSTEYIEKPCKLSIYRCRYTGRNTLEDACLYDNCKCCDVGYPKYPNEEE